MKTAKSSVRPLVVRTVILNLLTCLLVDGGAYYLMQTVSSRIGALAEVDPPVAEAGALIQWVETIQHIFWPYLVPASVAVFLLLSLLMVLVLKGLVVPRAAVKPVKKDAEKSGESKAEMARKSLEESQKLYLHLITVLQKEGRLLDFFSEDLSQYEDGQIGAAVRNIHESCRKALNDQVAPMAVLKQVEGDEILVEQDFDPNVIKLVGNVTGQPPFRGVVQHRGWCAGKLDLPTFSGQLTPDIIAPAEVEVK